MRKNYKYNVDMINQKVDNLQSIQLVLNNIIEYDYENELFHLNLGKRVKEECNPFHTIKRIEDFEDYREKIKYESLQFLNILIRGGIIKIGKSKYKSITYKYGKIIDESDID